jgi:hypothetical protein
MRQALRLPGELQCVDDLSQSRETFEYLEDERAVPLIE